MTDSDRGAPSRGAVAASAAQQVERRGTTMLGPWLTFVGPRVTFVVASAIDDDRRDQIRHAVMAPTTIEDLRSLLGAFRGVIGLVDDDGTAHVVSQGGPSVAVRTEGGIVECPSRSDPWVFPHARAVVVRGIGLEWPLSPPRPSPAGASAAQAGPVAAPEPIPEPEPVVVPEPEPEPEPEPIVVPEPEPEPEPVAVADEVDSEDAPDSHPEVRAVLCPNEHPNPPGSAACRICRTALFDHDVVTVPRPVLGRLHFSDATLVEVDRPLVIGSGPSLDDVDLGTHTEVPALHAVDDAEGTVSATHLHLRIDAWSMQLVDLGTEGGTFIRRKGRRRWETVTPFEPVLLVPGTEAKLGGGGVRFRVDGPAG